MCARESERAAGRTQRERVGLLRLLFDGTVDTGLCVWRGRGEVTKPTPDAKGARNNYIYRTAFTGFIIIYRFISVLYGNG